MNDLNLLDISSRLKTQDNLFTAEPIYLVQVEKRIYGIDPLWTDNTVFIDQENECDEVDLEAAGLTHEQAREASGLVETGYEDRWEFVNAHLTLQSAQRYIGRNSHRHSGKLRVYVDSMYRCPEMIAIREFLMGDMSHALLAARSVEELAKNSRKGDWAEYRPTPADLVSELRHHADKLLIALSAGDMEQAKEYLADLFNYTRKGWEIANG